MKSKLFIKLTQIALIVISLGFQVRAEEASVDHIEGESTTDVIDNVELFDHWDNDFRREFVHCGSSEYRFNSCHINGPIIDVRLIRQLSRSACIEGSTWGYDRNSVWVDRGCEGQFEVIIRNHSGGGGGNVEFISCSSRSYRYETCYASNGPIIFAELVRQNSDTRCIQGSNWGYTRNMIWVDRGCQGLFRVRTRR